ncbi:MAG: ABC transporter permease [Dehalococcoidia bacterium]|jgi:peptide/nickel transport system permease protein|nr:ABC transporter permease [Dehalococcoidia bacterium]
MTTAAAESRSNLTPETQNRPTAIYRYIRRNPAMMGGLGILSVMFIFWAFGTVLTDVDDARPLSFRPSQSPSSEHWLGTDRQGKDLVTVLVIGTPQTLRIGLIAGAIGITIGTMLAFIAGYFGGFIDGTIRFVVDTLQTIPILIVLVAIAIAIPGDMTVEMMALVVAMLAWLGPTRVLRSQVLVMRQQSYVDLARLTGMGDMEIIVKEMIPNLMPYIVANFVLAVAGAILASIGIEALGLGPFEANTLGMTIYWNIYYASLLNGWWWWWAPPIVIIVLLFVGLFLVTRGLDEWANPRLRKRV